MRNNQTFFCAIGEEPIQMIEVTNEIRSRFNEEKGFERCPIEITNNDDWHAFKHKLSSPSLFSTRRLFEISIKNKPTKMGEKTLSEVIAASGSGDIFFLKIILSYNKNPPWLINLIKNGESFSCVELNSNQVSHWILRRLARNGKRISKEAADYISEKNQGSLISTANEVDKLALLIDSDDITLKKIIELISDGSVYTVYHLKDALYQGSLVRAVKICNSLRKDNVEPMIVCWLLKKEFRTLLRAKIRLESGDDIAKICSSYNVWSRDQNAFKNTVNRLNSNELINLLEGISESLLGIKTGAEIEFWTELELILVKFIKPKMILSNSPKSYRMSKIG